MTITLSELTNKVGNFNKQIDIDQEGGITVDSAANVVSASARTLTLDLDQVGSYIDSLCSKHDTALVLGVWEEGSEFEEYDIGLSGAEDPDEGLVSRTKNFFQYANNDSVSLMYLDFDGSHSVAVRNTFLSELDIVIQEALVGELGHERKTICKWIRPSSSGSAKIKGKTGNGLHVYMAVKNASEELIKLIHRFCWMQPYGKGYKLTAAGTILAESLIDPAVGSPERVVYSSDLTCTGDGKDEFYEHIIRECEYHPGGIIDCESAVSILREWTGDFERNWFAYKKELDNSSDVRKARKIWKDAQVQKKVDAGVDVKSARKTIKALAEGILLSDESLLRNDGTEVLVQDILCDPDSWLGVGRFCDPIKRELNRNVGMILGNEERPFLNSKNHGGVKYVLKWNYEDLSQWAEDCDVDELEDWIAIHMANAVLSNIQSEKIVKAVAKRLEVGVVAVRSEVKDRIKTATTAPIDVYDDEVDLLGENATHGDIIDDYINKSGECRGYGNGLYTWNDGTIWEKHSVGYIQKRLRHEYNHVVKCTRVSDYKALSVAITSDDSISVDEWNQEYGVPCSDGFYRVIPGEGVVREDYTRELGCRFKLGFKPDFNMKTPLFDKVIANVGDEILYQQLMGLTVTRYLHKMQKVFTMFGEGGAGKGTTNDIITAMFPSKQVTSIALDKLNDERFLVALVDSQINIISEISSHKKIDLTGLKKASGGDGMSAWVLYQGQKFFTPSCSFILNMNNWISLKQVGSDVSRRLGHSIVKFTKNHDKQIDGLADKIIQHEMPGVLAWALDGVRTYFEYGMSDEVSLGLYKQWTSSVDPISLFFDECCVFLPRKKILRSDLYKALVKFCEGSSYYAPVKGVFFERLDAIREIGIERMTGGYFAKGVSLRM